MNFWLWLLIGGALALVIPSIYATILIVKKMLKLKNDVYSKPPELNEYDGEVDIYIPVNMVGKVTKRDLSKRKGLIAYHVVYSNKKWMIKRVNNSEIYAESYNRKLIIKLAKEYSKRDRAELKIHDKKGRIKISHSYGNDPRGNG